MQDYVDNPSSFGMEALAIDNELRHPGRSQGNASPVT